MITMKRRRIRWAGSVAHMAKKITAYRILMRKSEEKRSLERHRHREVDLRDTEQSVMGRTDLAQDRAVEDSSGSSNEF
jgi:hypothetical protein